MIVQGSSGSSASTKLGNNFTALLDLSFLVSLLLPAKSLKRTHKKSHIFLTIGLCVECMDISMTCRYGFSYDYVVI